MSFRASCLFLMVVAPWIGAQDGGLRIEGVVVDHVTEMPIPAAAVQVAGLKVSSDEQGRFAFNNVRPGRYVLQADKIGYSRARPEGRSGGQPGIPIVVTEQGVRPVAIRLVRAGSVTGRIYGSNGEGLGLLLVAPYRATYDGDGEPALIRVPTNGALSARESSGTALLGRVFPGRPSRRSEQDDLGAYSGGRTDDRGEFRLGNLEPGKYALRIVPMLNTPPDPTFYPGTSDSRRADIIEVQSGRETDIGVMVLPSGAEGKLHVQVIDRTGQPGTSAFVQVRRSGQADTVLQKRLASNPGGGECERDIRYCTEIGFLAPGSYELEAVVVVSGGAFVASAHRHLEMTSDHARLDVPVFPGATLAGQARFDYVEGAESPAASMAGFRFTLRSDETLPNVTFPVVSDPKGVFVLRSIPEGSYRVRDMEAPANLCVTRLLHGDRDVLASGVSVATPGLTLTVSLAVSQEIVRGVARNAEGAVVPGAIVAMVPDDRARNNAYAAVVADQNGAFAFTCIQPGSYTLFAWRELEGGAYRNADFLRKYEGQGRPVEVGTDPARIDADAVVLR